MQFAGRLIAGAGGVLLNVQMSKMVADWFAGREIATAMAIFINSWPAGVALSLLVLPGIATAYGVSAVHLAVAALIALGILALAASYQSPPNIVSAIAASKPLDRHAVMAVSVAGLIWGLFNVGFATVFSFGPSLLVERGWSITAAGSAISIALWIAVLSVPSGGVLADRTGRPQAILAVGCILFSLLLLAFTRSSAVVLVVIGLGLMGGLPAGPIMSLPRARAAACDPRHRHGYLLHRVLRRDDAGTDRGRRLRQMERQRGRRIRLRRSDAARLPSIALGI
ncbi:MFS transporter [Bradyrhizobium sp. TZ2]